jgi:hypothetical protein
MRTHRTAWNKGRLLGQKPPPEAKGDLVASHTPALADKARDLALFNLAIDSKLRGCDLVSLRVRDVYQGTVVASRAIVMQRKTHRPVQFEKHEGGNPRVRGHVGHAKESSIYKLPIPR